MTLKKFYGFGILLSVLLLSAGCTKPQKASENMAEDKYGCVMFNSMADKKEDVVYVKNLSPGGAVKITVPFYAEGGAGIISGEVINCDGTYFSQDVSYDEDEYVSSVGTNCSGDILTIKERLNDIEAHCYVEIKGEKGETFEEMTIPEEYYVFSGHSEVFEDESGYIHIGNIARKNGGSIENSYVVLKDGEVVYHRDLMNENGSCKLIILPDNSVAADIVEDKKDGRINHEVIQYKAEDSSCSSICKYTTAEEIRGDEIVALNVFDETHLVYLTCTGVYLSDYKLKNPEKLFDWYRNGVAFNSVITPFEEYRVCANKAGDVFALIEGYRGDEYLKLSKLPDNVVSIEIARAGGIRTYDQAVY